MRGSEGFDSLHHSGVECVACPVRVGICVINVALLWLTLYITQALLTEILATYWSESALSS